jgi:RimJ/RimL family protein N-acetyltransferase
MQAHPPHLVLTPVTRFDRERLADLFERLSPQSRYQRFLHPKPRLTEAELDYFTDIDHRMHDALAAVDPRDGSFVGVARYATLDDAGTEADLAFAVADEWHGQGVGTMLVGALLPRAEANGVERCIALTLSENTAARRLLANFGFRRVGSTHGVAELRLELQHATSLRLAA